VLLGHGQLLCDFNRRSPATKAVEQTQKNKTCMVTAATSATATSAAATSQQQHQKHA